MKICFVAPRFPYPVTKGDTLRAYHQIRELSRDHEIALVAAAERSVDAGALAEMQQFCRSIDVVRIGKVRSFTSIASRAALSPLPLQVLYFDAPALRRAVRRRLAHGSFDIIHGMTIRVAPAMLGVPGVPAVIDFMDSYAANFATRRELVGPIMRRVYDYEFGRVAAYERRVAAAASAGIVIAELDRQTIGDPRLHVVPNGVDAETLGFAEHAREPSTLVFTGNMGYQPNVDAVTWFAAACWPQLRARFPELRFEIVGARPAPAVAALAKIAGITVTGRVDSMAPYLHRATVSVCPIRCGSGMQNKILEAMAAGAPVVTTAFANRSIGTVDGRECSVAADADAFTEAVAALLLDPVRARRQAAHARRFVVAEFSWRRRADQLVAAYNDALTRRAA